jgi:hypothetical protein
MLSEIAPVASPVVDALALVILDSVAVSRPGIDDSATSRAGVSIVCGGYSLWGVDGVVEVLFVEPGVSCKDANRLKGFAASRSPSRVCSVALVGEYEADRVSSLTGREGRIAEVGLLAVLFAAEWPWSRLSRWFWV